MNTLIPWLAAGSHFLSNATESDLTDNYSDAPPQCMFLSTMPPFFLRTIPQVYPSYANSSPCIPPCPGYTPLSATRPRHLRHTKEVQAVSTLDLPCHPTTY